LVLTPTTEGIASLWQEPVGNVEKKRECSN